MVDSESILDVVIVGSGPAGVAAALACADKGIRPTILDVGNEPERTETIDENFYQYAAAHDAGDFLVGDDFSGLYNLDPCAAHVPLPLTLPKASFVCRDTDRLLPLEQQQISIAQSLAKGGLANAWGCAAFRYDDRDMASFPIVAADLEPYYDTLTREIGINGADDDLTPFYGSVSDLQPPPRLGINSSILLRNYQRHRDRFHAKRMYVGRMRLAVLTEDLGDRRAHPYFNTDLYCRVSAFYNPIYTLDRLIEADRVRYVPSVLVEKWSTDRGIVHVETRNTKAGDSATFRCRRLLLAAGTVNSARIVLQSFSDYTSKLPLVDNPAVYIPCFLPRRLGKRLDTTGYGYATLTSVFDFDEYSTHLQGLLFELMNTPRAEFFRYMPFNASFNAELVQQILPAMMVLLLCFPSDALTPGSLQLNPAGKLLVHGPPHSIDNSIVKRVLRLVRPLGLYSHSSLAEPVPYGGAIHYAGCLPMTHNPTSPYHTTADGVLAGDQNVSIVDGAALPALSSKNHTLTIMANAMRIATKLCESKDK